MYAPWFRLGRFARAMVVVALLAWPAWAAGPVTIRQAAPQGAAAAGDKAKPLFVISAGGYSAEVSPDGRLRVLAGKTELLSGLVLEQGRDLLSLGQVRRDANDRVILQAAAPAAGAAPATPPGVTLRFLADRIEIETVGLPERKGDKPPDKPFTISGLLGDEAAGVRNLRNGQEDALPTRRICSRHIFSFYGWYGNFWPEVEAAYADGTHLEIRGITGISHYAIGQRDPYTAEALKARRGFWSLREAAADSRITLAIRPAGRDGPIAQAPYCTIRPDKPRGLFHEAEPVIFHLDFADGYLVPGKWRIDWALEDHRQRSCGEGRQETLLAESGPMSVPVRLEAKEMGYFRARLTLSRADGPSARRVHEVSFARIRPECPDLRELDGQKDVDGEMLWANILGMRGLRLNPSWADNWRRHGRPDGTIDWDAWRKRYEAYLAPARRGTVRCLFSFTGAEATGDLAKWFQKQYPDQAERERQTAEARRHYLTEYVREASRLGVRAWEPINEPDLRMTPEKYVEDVLKPQYAAVKAGDPNANFLGGSLCGLEKHSWLDRLYGLGGQQWFDGVSMHPYTGVGFQEVYRAELERWREVMARHNDASGGLWMTESAWHRGWAYNDYVYDRFGAFRQSEARNAVLMHLNAEPMGIGRERIYVFYLVEHGYNDFYLVTHRHPTSAAVAIQVMNECLRDAAFRREIPLPRPGWYFQVYGDKSRTVAVAFTAGEDGELEVATDAKAVTVMGLMGNRRVVAPQAGRLRLPIGGDPTYLAVAPGESIAPSYAYDKNLQVQPNLANPTLGAKAAASSVAQPKGKPALPPDAAICGDWTGYAGAGALSGARRGWDEEDANRTFPDWFEVRLPVPAPIARVRVCHDYGAWERLLRDYDVQAHVGGAWRTVAEVRGNRYGFIFDHRFEPVRTDRIRLLIRDVNACLFESMTWIPKLSSLRAVEVYAAPAGAAEAFFLQEPPRRRIMAPGEQATIAFGVQNATDKELAADVRLILPPGVAAEPAARKVTLPPAGQAECTFQVRLAAEATEGLHTILAGLYQGERMISTDYAAAVLCAKKASVSKDAAKPMD